MSFTNHCTILVLFISYHEIFIGGYILKNHMSFYWAVFFFSSYVFSPLPYKAWGLISKTLVILLLVFWEPFKLLKHEEFINCSLLLKIWEQFSNINVFFFPIFKLPSWIHFTLNHYLIFLLLDLFQSHALNIGQILYLCLCVLLDFLIVSPGSSIIFLDV